MSAAGPVDAHHHLWADPARYPWLDDPAHAPIRRPFTVADLGRALAGSGVTATVLVEGGSTDPRENDVLLRTAADSPPVAAVVAWAEPADPGFARDLARLRAHPDAARLRGVRAHLQEEPDDQVLRDPRLLAGLEHLAGTGLVFELLLRPAQLADAAAAAARLPGLPLVLDHLGKPPVRDGRAGLHPWRAHLAGLAARPNVTAKLSGLVTEADRDRWTPADLRPYLDTALELFGPGRLMAGSDWPVCLLAATHHTVLATVHDAVAELTSAERAAVLGGTARRVYRLGSQPGAEVPGEAVGEGDEGERGVGRG